MNLGVEPQHHGNSYSDYVISRALVDIPFVEIAEAVHDIS